MKYFNVMFRIPTGYIGADIEEEQLLEFDDALTDAEIENLICNELEEWVDEQLEDLRCASEFEILDEN